MNKKTIICQILDFQSRNKTQKISHLICRRNRYANKLLSLRTFHFHISCLTKNENNVRSPTLIIIIIMF